MVSELLSFFNVKVLTNQSFFSVQVLAPKSVFKILVPYPKSFYEVTSFLKIFTKDSSSIHQVVLIAILNFLFSVTNHKLFNLFIVIDKLVILFILVMTHLNLKDEFLQNNFKDLLFDFN